MRITWTVDTASITRVHPSRRILGRKEASRKTPKLIPGHVAVVMVLFAAAVGLCTRRRRSESMARSEVLMMLSWMAKKKMATSLNHQASRILTSCSRMQDSSISMRHSSKTRPWTRQTYRNRSINTNFRVSNNTTTVHDWSKRL